MGGTGGVAGLVLFYCWFSAEVVLGWCWGGARKIPQGVSMCAVCVPSAGKVCSRALFTCRMIMSGLYCLRSPTSNMRNLSMLKASSSPKCNSSTPAMKDRPWQ